MYDLNTYNTKNYLNDCEYFSPSQTTWKPHPVSVMVQRLRNWFGSYSAQYTEGMGPCRPTRASAPRV